MGGVKAPLVMWVGGGWAGGGADGRPQDRINRIRVMASVSLYLFRLRVFDYQLIAMPTDPRIA